MTSKRFICFSALLLVAAVLPAERAGATWSGIGVTVGPFTYFEPTEKVAMTSDGSGGVIIAWKDEREDIDCIYARRVDSSGNRLWTVGGVLIYNGGHNPNSIQIAPDGSGGAIIGWCDYRSSDCDVYAQRIDANGTVQWTLDGVAVCTASERQTMQSIVADGSGGAILTWGDERSGSERHIYSQKLDSSGNALWTADGLAVWTSGGVSLNSLKAIDDKSGGMILTWTGTNTSTSAIYVQRVLTGGTVFWPTTFISTSLYDAFNPSLAADTGTGALVTWVEDRLGTDMIFCQKISAIGTELWTSGDVLISATAGTSYTELEPDIASDGSGGAFVTWNDYSLGTWNPFAQRVTSGGIALWGAGGLAITSIDSSVKEVTASEDGSGGLIVTWLDNRSEVYFEIYAQRLDVSGTELWTSGGVSACPEKYLWAGKAVTPDGAGGIIVSFGRNKDLIAQKVSSAGVPAWGPVGIMPCDGTPDQYAQSLAPDGTGGAIFAWIDTRNEVTSIYSQRINGGGTVMWDPEGEPLVDLPGGGESVELVTDGSNGAIVAWLDSRAGNMDVYVQRVDGSGTGLWTANGIAVTSSDSNEAQPALVPDGSGGAILAWVDRQGGDGDIYTQRIDPYGSALWAAGGISVCGYMYEQFDVRIAPDGAGGALIAWIDDRDGNDNVYAQRIGPAGTALWTVDGVAVCSDLSRQTDMVLVPDGTGGAIMLWIDDRAGGSDVYAQRIGAAGSALWTAGGVLVADRPYDITALAADADGLGGVIFSFIEDDLGYGYRSSFSQRISDTAAPVWTVSRLLTGGWAGDSHEIAAISDGAGGATFVDLHIDYHEQNYVMVQQVDTGGNRAWADYRYYMGSGYNIERLRAVSDGASGVIAAWTTGRDFQLYSTIRANRIEGAICEIYPEEIDFGPVDLFEQKDSTFVIRNIGDLPFYGQVSETASYFSIESDSAYSIMPNDSHVVTVRYTADYPGTHLCTLQTGRLICSDVELTALGAGPVCDIYPSDITMPAATAVGGEHDTTFTITNSGGGLLLGSIAEDSDHYTIISGGGPFGLYEDESRIVTVRFEPLARGVHVCVVGTGAFGCGEVTITSEAFECPADSVLYVDADAAGYGDGTSWADAYTDLQDALARAADCGGVTEIWVAEGTYYPSKTDDPYESFILRSGLKIYGGFDGTETALEPRAMLVSTTILSGDIGAEDDIDDNSFHVVTGNYTDSTAVLDGFTITLGYARESGNEKGAGYFTSEGSPVLRNLVFKYNKAADIGGGIYQRNNSDAKLYNCVFFANEAEYFGGGIYNDVSSPLIANCTFCRNRAGDTGAAVFNENSSNPVIVNAIMWEDSTSSMYAPEIGNHGSSNPVISYSTVQYCYASGHWETGYGVDGGKNTQDDPSLLNIAAGDLHLLDASGAIDQGDQMVPGLPEIDMDGNPRVQGGEIDMGAYEGGCIMVNVSLDTEPEHLELTIDGETVTAQHDFHSRSGAVHEIGAPTPQLIGDAIYSFSHWSDAGDTIHEVTLPASTPAYYTATYTWAYAHASIDSIVDVPGDQGGWVRVHFRRSHYDDASEATYPIERYDMHRRVDSPALAAAVLSEGKRVDNGYIEYDGRRFVVLSGLESILGEETESPAAAPPGVWEVVGTVSAAQQENYIGLSPTLADSSAVIPYSVYYVSAHSTTPAVYFDSPADSGYSVDNIAPGVPLGMAVSYNTGSGNHVTWDPSPEEDFQYYRIYRGGSEDFVPGPGNLVHQTATESWNDPEYDGWDVYYKVTALDHAGNESPAASPGTTTGDDIPGIPVTYALHQNVPNPFNPSTVIRFDLPEAARVRLFVYNVKGELVARLVDGYMPAGRKEVLWNAETVSSGVYFYRLIAGDFVQTRKMVLLR